MSSRVYTVNVMDFGAVGDGIADDTAAIQRAVNAAGRGGTVLFPAGRTFKTTSLITIPHDGVTLSGAGAIITSASETQFRKFLFSGRTRGAVLGLRFECLYSATTAELGDATVDIIASSDVTVRDCEFNDIAESGIRITGASPRCKVEGNRFYRNFCAIFVDDDGGSNQPTKLQIKDNDIRTGLSTAAFSGGIKISGIDGTSGYHVISGNVIDAAGEMGIEVQGPGDLTIEDNVVTGTVYGISLSGSRRVAVVGNQITICSFIALEVASDTVDISIFGNVIRQTESGARGIWVVSGSRNVTISGNRVDCTGDCIYLQGGPVQISANFFSNKGGVYLHNASDVSCVGNTFVGGTGTFAAFSIDATDFNVGNVTFSNNNIISGYENCGIMLYSPNSKVISDVLVCDNKTTYCSFAVGAFNDTSAGDTKYTLQRIRCYDNFWQASSTAFNAFSVPMWETSESRTFPAYGYYWHERGMIKVNATDGVKNWGLPNASGMGGYQITFMKSDGSANPVMISGYIGQTIQGMSAVALTSQYDKMTFLCDSSNWSISSSGRT